MKNSRKSCKANRISRLYLVGFLFVALTALTGLALGSSMLSHTELMGAFTSPESVAGRILLYVRLPRVAACLICGGALAVSGGVIQNVLANKLASPGIIGVNSGAGLAVTLCAAMGIYGGWILSLSSFAGAFLAVLIISLGAKRWGASRGTLILMGVAMNSFLGGISDAVITLDTDAGLMSNDFKVGDFSAVTYNKLIPALIITAVTLILLLTLSNELDLLTLGEENARGLGLNTGMMRILFLLTAALLAGCAVSIAGLLSFVGLIVPHVIRKLGGSASRHLIPLCALFGGGFVCLCDTVARTAFSPYEIPVGIIMAFIGAPFFIFILVRRSKDA